MTDIQTMKDMLTGLKSKKKSLEADEKIFLKVSGLNEEIEKANQDKAGYDDELKEAKQRRDDAKSKKAESVSKTAREIESKMNEVLPSGEAVFNYGSSVLDDKIKMEIGWRDGEIVTPYNGLSGMQKQVFDAALANVLDANIIVVEAAELDGSSLLSTLKQLSTLDKQVIVNTCHSYVLDVEGVPEPFEMIEI